MTALNRNLAHRARNNGLDAASKTMGSTARPRSMAKAIGMRPCEAAVKQQFLHKPKFGSAQSAGIDQCQLGCPVSGEGIK